MKIADLVVKVANPYFPIPLGNQPPSENFLIHAMDYACRKKVFPLFYEGCIKNQFQLPKEAHILMSQFRQRREKQIEAAKLLVNIQEQHGIELVFFKTFRPFNYIPDDIDLLIRDEASLRLLISLLKKEDYFVYNVGTPEMGLRKVEGGIYVDLDIHKHLAVGSLDLFDVEGLWRKHTFETLDVGGGYKVQKLSEDYEVVREAAYSLLKDFNLSIAGLYLGINALMKRDMEVIAKIAFEQNFPLHLHLYLDVVYYAACKFFGAEAERQLCYEQKNEHVPLNLNEDFKIPYPYPVPAIVYAYLSKVILEINRNGNVGVIPQIMKQPGSKGVSVLLDYVREHFN
jgi:hypothetical protein